MTRKNQIRLTLLVVASISFGVSFLSLSYMSRMATRIADIAAVDSRMTEIAESLSNRMREARQAERNFILFLDTTYIDQTRRILDAMTAEAEEARQISTIYSSQFDSVGMSLDSYGENIQQLTRIFREDPRMLGLVQQELIETEREIRSLARSRRIREGDWMTDLGLSFAADSKLPSETTRLFQNLDIDADRIFVLSRRILSNARASLASGSEQAMLYGVRARRNILSLLMISGLGLVLLIYFVPRRIFAPIQGILRALRAVGRGDVEFPMPDLKAKDEIGELARAFSDATHKIRYFNELITDKIVEIKRNQQRILEEIEEGVILAAPDYKITFVNQAAREIFKFKGEIASLKDVSLLWEPLQGRLDQIDQTGRIILDLKINPRSLRTRQVSVIPRPGKTGRTESILIMIR
jgi:PAS domain-containing protein